MGEWKEFKLSDLAEIRNTKRNPLSKMERLKIQGNYPYYGASGIVDYVNEYKFDGEFVLISEDGENLKTRNTPIAFKANGKFWVNNHAHIIQGKKEYLNDLVIYFFANLDLNPYITGAVQPKLSKGNLLAIPIYLPKEEDEQKAIAEVLSSLDDKIDLLHRQNRTLEELAQTLFRQWFIEEAKDDWEVGTLDDIMNFNPTHSIKKGFLSPFLEMKNVQTNKSSVADWYKREFTSGTKFKNDDTLLSRITPSLENGKTAYVDFLKKDEIGWGSTEFIVMRMKNSFHPFISYLVARNKDFRKFAIGNMTGSTGRQRVQAQDIKMYEIAIPPIEEIKKLNIVIEPIPIKIKSNSKQIKTLENMRDTLLPKLMSGEVRIKDE